jgi:nitrogen-specific signal transduction histidine kinase
MANAGDFFDELKGANGRLNGVNDRLDTVNGGLSDVKNKLDDVKKATDEVHAAVDALNGIVKSGLDQLITLSTYANQALYHLTLQNETIICVLEKISKNTCDFVNQAHLQTALQTRMQSDMTVLADLYAATHAEAALTREREQILRIQIEKCCPPRSADPACTDQPCREPEPLAAPTSSDIKRPH